MTVADVIEPISVRVHQILQRDIQPRGKYPVVSQSDNAVEGYTNAEIAITDVPLVLFGDHTCCLKYIQEPFVVGADGVRLLKSKDGDSEFLYYYLATLIPSVEDGRYRRHYVSLTDLEINMPPKEVRGKIGYVLSAIDRKIALNRKRIATLEAMAKEIYDYWFVQFDFPDAHGRPYKSSGSAMVYDPDLKREIPKGWEAKSINDCGAFFRGVGYSKADERARGTNTVLVMRGNNISNGRIVDDSDRVFIDKSLVSAEQLMDRFSVLFAMSSGSKEHVGKAAVYYDYPANAAFGAFCSKYVPRPHYRYMMFCFLVSETYRAFVKRICGGTGINNMKSEHFDVPLFAVPHDEALLHKFNDMAEQAYSQIYNCTQENAKLIGLRDFLLPLLMNGQVKVG